MVCDLGAKGGGLLYDDIILLVGRGFDIGLHLIQKRLLIKADSIIKTGKLGCMSGALLRARPLQIAVQAIQVVRDLNELTSKALGQYFFRYYDEMMISVDKYDNMRELYDTEPLGHVAEASMGMFAVLNNLVASYATKLWGAVF